ncbi:MFS transporter [Kineobactrum salinum]|uniref:MFS transporter n=1 Tax=Kineobactrum salinum TaxID=2708301 RepID=A0A6C0U025_9GAMM|nr:MFS transporter [Kineobactrum salinum]QIB64939.1 MFS transporter [Kineobactrum salinum]
MAIPQTSAVPTRHPIDRKSVYIAAGLLSGAGALISSTMPMIIGTMADTFKFSESQLGDIIAVFNLTFTLIAIASLFFIRRINWRLAAFLGSGVSVASLFAVTLTGNYQTITMLFGVMGIGIGGLYVLGMVVMGDSENPDRAFGVKLGLEALPSTTLLFILPVFVIPLYGFTGMAYAMAATCFIIGLLSGVLPSRGVKNNPYSLPTSVEATSTSNVVSLSSTALLTLSLFTLAAGIVFFSGILATWAFLEIMATNKQLPAEQVGVILALSMISSAVGAFVAAWLGNRWGRDLPMIGIVLVNLIALVVIWQSKSIVSFAAGAILFTFCVNYGLAYFFGLSAEIDVSGRFVALSATTLSLGGVVGPALGGRIMEGQGFVSVLAFSAICSILSLIMFMTATRITRAS